MKSYLFFILTISLGLMGCQAERPAAAGNSERADHAALERLLNQIFGPEGRRTEQDIFYGRSKVEVKPTATVRLPSLVGIVLQGGRPAAFFVDSGGSFTGKEGDRIAERYQIVRIEADYVVLEDLSTGKSYRVLLRRG